MTLPPDADQFQFPLYANARQYDAEWDRLAQQAYFFNRPGILPITIPPWLDSVDGSGAGPGIPGELKITTGGNDLDLFMATGRFCVQGNSRSTQGMYFGRNAEQQTITAATADLTDPRIDLVRVTVRDADVSGTLTEFDYGITTGTPTPGANLTNLSGAPALPDDSEAAAFVLVPSSFTGPFVNVTHIRDARSISCPPGTLMYRSRRTTLAAINSTSESVISNVGFLGVLPSSADEPRPYFHTQRIFGAAGNHIIRVRDSGVVGVGNVIFDAYHNMGGAGTPHHWNVIRDSRFGWVRQPDGLYDCRVFTIVSAAGSDVYFPELSIYSA